MIRRRAAATSVAIGEPHRLVASGRNYGLGIRACARVAGAVPSVPRAGKRPEASRKGIVAGEQSVSDWDLPAPGDAELLAEHIAVCFCRSRRDPKSLADFLVGAARSDQLDHLTLSLGDACWDFGEGLLHGP